jgi:hypothetical protein
VLFYSYFKLLEGATIAECKRHTSELNGIDIQCYKKTGKIVKPEIQVSEVYYGLLDACITKG